jgi:hypothetical protein
MRLGRGFLGVAAGASISRRALKPSQKSVTGTRLHATNYLFNFAIALIARFGILTAPGPQQQ